MQYGIVKGTVIATQKSPELRGLQLKILLPCNSQKEILGGPIVAGDAIGTRPGDLVMWVGKREASMAVDHPEIANLYPLDAAITGIIDDIS